MSLWNPKSVFSRPSVPGPSSGYDLTWPGDPLRETPGRPGVGFGEAYVGRVATDHDRPRNPIGFAPPRQQEHENEPETPTRFRTEVSFRRHQELPRATAVSEPRDSDQPAWEAPKPALEFTSGPSERVDAAFEEILAEKAQPFYRREISFRRKKAATPAPVEASDDRVSPDAPVLDQHKASTEIEPEVAT